MEKEELKVDILGVQYAIKEMSKDDDNYLLNYDGYCDKTSKKIIISKEDKNSELDDYSVYQKKVLRHEIIHAFLFESGLHECWEHKQYGHDETYVDWIAVQFPKLYKVFNEVGCL